MPIPSPNKTVGAANIVGDLNDLYSWANAADAGLKRNIIAASNSPSVWKNVARWICPGTGGTDHTTINTALSDIAAEFSASTGAYSPRGGHLVMAPGLYRIGTPGITMQDGVWLQGSGERATVIRVETTWAQTGDLAAINFDDGGAARYGQIAVTDLSIVGYTTNNHGIYISRTGLNTTFLAGAPDCGDLIANVLIADVDGCGLKIMGGRARGCKVVNLRVFACGNIAGRHGVHMEGIDSHMVNVDVGTCGDSGIDNSTHGIYARGSDTLWSNCRAWLCGGSGFYIDGNGQSFTGCSAHDNARHGFEVTYDRNLLSGCRAYNNGIVAGSGFKISTSGITVDGCNSYDVGGLTEHPNKTQSYGYEVDAGVDYVMLTGVAGQSTVRRNVLGDTNSLPTMGNSFVKVVGHWNGVTTKP